MSEQRQRDDACLRDAIEHASEVAEKNGDTPCGREHRQLVGWLEELRELRGLGYLVRTRDTLKMCQTNEIVAALEAQNEILLVIAKQLSLLVQDTPMCKSVSGGIISDLEMQLRKRETNGEGGSK